MEGHYRSPQREHWDMVHGVAPPTPFISDQQIAMEVEEVIRQWAEESPKDMLNRFALKLWYVNRASPGYMCRHLRRDKRLRPEEVQILLYDGRQTVEIRLQTQKKTISILANSIPSLKLVDAALVGGRTVAA